MCDLKIKLNKYTAVILVIIMISTIIYNENIIKADNMFSGNGSLNGWSYDDSWSNGTYTGAGSCVYDSDSNMMKVSFINFMESDRNQPYKLEWNRF